MICQESLKNQYISDNIVLVLEKARRGLDKWARVRFLRIGDEVFVISEVGKNIVPGKGKVLLCGVMKNI